MEHRERRAAGGRIADSSLSRVCRPTRCSRCSALFVSQSVSGAAAGGDGIGCRAEGAVVIAQRRAVMLSGCAMSTGMRVPYASSRGCQTCRKRLCTLDAAARRCAGNGPMLLLRRGRAQAEADGHSRTVKTRLSGSAKQTGRHEYEWEDHERRREELARCSGMDRPEVLLLIFEAMAFASRGESRRRGSFFAIFRVGGLGGKIALGLGETLGGISSILFLACARGIPQALETVNTAASEIAIYASLLMTVHVLSGHFWVGLHPRSRDTTTSEDNSYCGGDSDWVADSPTCWSRLFSAPTIRSCGVKATCCSRCSGRRSSISGISSSSWLVWPACSCA